MMWRGSVGMRIASRAPAAVDRASDAGGGSAGRRSKPSFESISAGTSGGLTGQFCETSGHDAVEVGVEVGLSRAPGDSGEGFAADSAPTVLDVRAVCSSAARRSSAASASDGGGACSAEVWRRARAAARAAGSTRRGGSWDDAAESPDRRECGVGRSQAESAGPVDPADHGSSAAGADGGSSRVSAGDASEAGVEGEGTAGSRDASSEDRLSS